MNLAEIEESLIDGSFKGIPGSVRPFPLKAIGQQDWNVLRGDLPFPLAILKKSALAHNSQWMRQFIALTGAKLCPHGKTTMSPQLYRQQLADGAWGITLATMNQVQVARRFGVGRIFLANELVGRAAIEYIVRELAADPTFDFYALVDSVAGVELLAEGVRRFGSTRPLQLLVEVGVLGKRCGCRDLETSLQVAEAVQRHTPHLALVGIEGFEGVISSPDPAEAAQKVRDYMRLITAVAARCDERSLFAPGRILLTAGGSSYFDLVVDELSNSGLQRPVDVVIRSGCYLSHDSLICERYFRDIVARNKIAQQLGAGPRAAIEIWSYVQSRPEATRAVLSMGKRDCSFDIEMPCATHWYRPGVHASPQQLPADHRVVGLNDQHALFDLPASSPLQVGDMIASGISHPCTTFDRWQLLPVVDDDYNVVEAVRTFF